mgnify:CR=1 FL=1
MEEKDSNQFLCGYFVAESQVEKQNLTCFMQKYLTPYMVPSVHATGIPALMHFIATLDADRDVPPFSKKSSSMPICSIELFGSRIQLIEGDITDPDKVDSLEQYGFSRVINCAACVKHFRRHI